CNVKPDCVIENCTVPVLYEAPLMLEEANISSIICRELGISAPTPDLAEWREMVERVRHQNHTVNIGLVGKYVQLHDAYLSVAEALRHAGYALAAKVEITWIDSETLTEENLDAVLSPLQGIIVPGGFGSRGIEGMILTAKYAREHRVPYFGICLGMQIAVIEFARNKAGLAGKYVGLHDAYLSVAEALHHAGFSHNVHINIRWIDTEEIREGNAEEVLAGLDGILVPGGFGSRGVEGMILAAKYARDHDVPYFGICLGMQVAVIEYARNAAGIPDANSGEFDERCRNKVIDFMPGQSDDIDKGGTLRLGAYPCVITPGTTMERCYGQREISERHRHRYELNNDYREALTQSGMVLSGISPDGRLVETVELPGRAFFVGVQYHPEFKSRPNKPHPLFLGFIGAAMAYARRG
ncbi:MAG: CTP synthase, partial [Lachnospiraceae bacterium]|nr:CTP synthase [Lachnospiraceae bacterium]